MLSQDQDNEEDNTPRPRRFKFYFSLFALYVLFVFLSSFFTPVILDATLDVYELFFRPFIQFFFKLYVNLSHFFIVFPDYVERFFVVCNPIVSQFAHEFFVDLVYYIVYYERFFVFEFVSFFAETWTFHLGLFESIFICIFIFGFVAFFFSSTIYHILRFLVFLGKRYRFFGRFPEDDRFKQIMAMKNLLKSMREDGVEVKISHMEQKKKKHMFYRAFFNKLKRFFFKKLVSIFRVAERLKAADCKSVPSGTQVRILPLPFFLIQLFTMAIFILKRG